MPKATRKTKISLCWQSGLNLGSGLILGSSFPLGSWISPSDMLTTISVFWYGYIIWEEFTFNGNSSKNEYKRKLRHRQKTMRGVEKQGQIIFGSADAHFLQNYNTGVHLIAHENLAGSKDAYNSQGHSSLYDQWSWCRMKGSFGKGDWFWYICSAGTILGY